MATQAITEVSSVAHIDGVAKVRLPDGSLKELSVGDTLQPGMVVILDDGAQLTLKDDAIQLGQDESGQAVPNDVAPADNALSSDIAQLQQSILVGADPTQAFEAAAAGAAVDAGIGAGSGNSGFVSIDRSGDATIAEAGYDTTTVVSSTSDLSAAEPVTASTSEVDSTPPSITVDAPALTNDRTPTITGTTDLPVGSTISLTVTDSVGVQQTFTTTVQTGGAYSVDVPSELAEGNYSVTATATDVAGNSASATDSGGLSINDAPTLTVTLVNAFTEDATSNQVGSVVAHYTTADAENNPVTVTLSDTTNYALDGAGNVTLTQAGLALVNSGQALPEFTLTPNDGRVDGLAANVDPSVTAVNDAATVSSASVTLSETDAALSTGGTLTATDVDNTDNVFQPASINGTYGTFTIDAAGAWTFVANSAFNELNVGNSYTETFAVKSADGTPSSVQVTITGSNDAATVSSASVTLSETDAALSTGGTLTATDVDNTDNVFQPASINGTYGTFTIDAAGAWTFVANSAFNELNVGNSYTETFAVKSADGTPSSVQVTITGSNDAATVSSASVTLSETDAALSTGGTLTATDVDNTDNVFQPASINGTYGTFTIDAAGAWTFVANSAFNELNVGNSYTETFAVKSADGTPSSVQVTITGSNDAATVSSASVTLSETDAALSTGGTLTATDVDNTDNVFQPASINGTYGTFTIDAAGAWTFVANSAFNELNVGNSYTETFAVKSADGTPSSVQVTITGSNDAATVSSASVTLSETDAALSTGGTLTATDVDNTDNVFQPASINGTYGTFTIDAAGAWTFVANSAFNELNVGNSYTETFAVKSADGTPSSVQVTITGSNDAATVSSASVTLSETDAALSTGGTLTATDVDNTDNVFQPASINGTYGTFTIDAAGAWTFVANSAFNELNVGNSYTETFAVKSADGTPSSVQVTITGSNDAATVSSASVTLSETDAALSTGGTLTATDVDNTDNVFQPASINGTYGTFTIDAAGAWTFVANSAFNELNVGNSYTETFAVKSADGTPSSVQVTITGSNDAATVSSASVTLSETDAALSTGGTLTATDVDNTDNVFQPASINGTYGTFTIDAAGAWTFVANSAFNELNVGNSYTETFAVKSADGTPSSVQVTITGSNDAATVSSASVTLSETDAALSTGGTLTATDVDNTDNVFQPASINGTYGTFTIDAAGAWTFVANSAFNELNVGNSYTETFAVKSADGTPSSVQVTITGSNDAATVSSASVTLSETDAALSTGGTLTATDVDNTDNVFQPASINGTYGTFTIDAAGAWTFVANSAFNELNVGNSYTETFAVKSADGTPSSVQVTITGSNDAATVSSASVTLSETDAALSTGGTLTATDVDNTDNVFQPASINGTYGTFTIDAAGAWTFVANSAFNELNVGNSYTETFAVKSADGTPSSVQVTITGSNDAATVSSASVTLSETDAALSTGGTLTATDVDNTDNVFQPASINGTYGTFTIDAAGAWTFVANSAFNELNVGNSYTETFAVKSADGTPSSVQVTITGSNDAATVSSASVTLSETDAALSTGGTLTATDVDNTDNVFQPASINGTYGTFTIDAAGAWTFVANSAFNELNVGNSYTETFAVKSADGTPSSVQVTITGSNDAATVSSASVTLSETDAALSTGGTLTATDVDNTDNVFQPASINGTYGTFTIDAAGAWTFVANSAFNELNVGNSYTETFAVKSADGTPSSVQVTITGSNDAATVSSASVTLSETDAALSTGGTLTATDVDNTDNVFQPASINGTYGTFTIDAAGAWTFVANSAFNELNVGNSYTETFAVKSADGTPSSVQVTITGSNDAATVSSASVTLSETDAALSTGGTLTATDVDNTDNVFQPASINGTYGTFTIDAAGAWTFVANSAFNELNVGNSYTETFAVKSADGTPSSVQVTITGSNDAATVSSASVTLSETDAALSTGGTLTATDVDNTDNVFQPASINGTYGTFTIDAAGAWTFVANSAFNELNVGNSYTETFAVKSADGTPSSVQVTITGSNDAATVSSASVTLSETDAALSTGGTLTATDVDNTDNVFQPASINGTYGTFTIDAAGAWTFVANSAFNELNVGNSYTETFAVKSADGTPSSVQVTITGSNDAATVSSASVTLSETDAALSTGGTLTATDVDNTDNVFQPASINGTYGTFTIDAAGAWTFVANSAFNELNVGNSYTETFAVKSADGTPSSVQVTITGSNDAATVSSASVTLSETDAALSTGGTLTATDVDNTDNVFQPASINGTYGTFTIDAAGAWTFVANSAFNELNVGNSYTETFAVKSADGTPSSVQVTITGSNDIAIITGTATGSVVEAGGLANASLGTPSVAGVLSVTDADTGQSSFATPASLAGTYGTFTFNKASGVWSYTLDNSKAATQALTTGQEVHDTLSVTSLDGTASQTIDVTVTGANDAPTIGTPQITVSVSEEGLSGGIIDTTGNPDSTDATGSLGNLVFNDIDSTKLSVSLTAPTETLTSGGQSIIWTSSTDSSGNALLVGHIGSATGAAVLTVTCDTAGHYTVSLEKPIDHAYQGEDVKSLTIGVSVSDGSETTSGSLVVNVEDDAPLASNSTQTIYVASDVISVNDLKAGFINDTYLNNTSSVTRTNTDSDSYNDSLRWGTAATSGGSKSGYNLVDNSTYSSSAGSDVTAGTAFKVGDFTHINYAINSDSSTLSSTDMTMSMDVVINGVSTAVSFVVHITHTETPNSSDALASRDIITLPAQTVSVEIDGQDYQVNLLGFKDSSGNVVNTIYTNEDTSNNTFGIYASVTSTADLPQVTGDILTQSGADGAYLYSVAVNGVTYAYNPANGGSVSTSGGTSKGVFDTTTNSLTITTTLGGKFVVNLDSGEYVYTAPATVVSTTAENIAYIIKDNDGDTANAALTINVTAPSVTTLTSTTSSAANMGLSGEYYGYNDTSSPGSGYNVHKTDGSQGNIDNIADTIAIINAKQDVTTSIVGTSTPEKASASTTDAVFVATTLNYGNITSGNLGYNNKGIEVSDANAPKVLTAATGDNLFVFLNKGSSSGDANSLVATSSYGNTTDAIVRMLGEVYLTGGSYKFKVTADDGYSIYVDGRQIFAYDANTSSKESISSSIAISEGLHNIEIVYWDQGGAANFSMSYSLDGGATYLGFNSTNLALFQDNQAPTLSELQDLVSVNGSWVVRTGSDFTGTSGNDNVTGSDGRDHIRGGDGNDVLSGGSGSDKLEGGTGNDHLIGSLGDDILIGGDGDDHLYGGLGNDTMTGGTGVDRFVWNANDQGTTGAPAIDHITDFSKTSDIIDIRDLLDTNGDKTLTALKAYLSVSTDSNSNITIEVHQGNTGLSTDITNKIVLDGVHYSDFGSGATATTILNTLVDSQHLLIDKS